MLKGLPRQVKLTSSAFSCFPRFTNWTRFIYIIWSYLVLILRIRKLLVSATNWRIRHGCSDTGSYPCQLCCLCWSSKEGRLPSRFCLWHCFFSLQGVASLISTVVLSVRCLILVNMLSVWRRCQRGSTWTYNMGYSHKTTWWDNEDYVAYSAVMRC